MANNESEVERRAGIDMVPLGESYEWRLGPDDGGPILLRDSHLKVSEQVAKPAARNTDPKKIEELERKAAQ